MFPKIHLPSAKRRSRSDAAPSAKKNGREIERETRWKIGKAGKTRATQSQGSETKSRKCGQKSRWSEPGGSSRLGQQSPKAGPPARKFRLFAGKAG